MTDDGCLPPEDVHRIRLRSPWDAAPAPHGSLRLTRRFNRPTGLLPHLEAWLVVEGATVPGTIALNGTPLGRFGPGSSSRSIVEYRVTTLLQLHNLIVAELQPLAQAVVVNDWGAELAPSAVEKWLGQVRLEIRGQDAAWVPEPRTPGYDDEDDKSDDSYS